MISQSEKTNPIQTQFSSKAKMSANAFSQKDYENETAFRPRKNKPNQTQFHLPPKVYNRSPMPVLRGRISVFCLLFSVFCPLPSVSSLLFLSIMDCKIANVEDTPFARRNQLPAASARASVTAQPAAIITIRAKIMYLTLTSLKKRSKKRKYTPKTAITKAKNAITTSTQHNNAQAGWI